MSQDSGTCYSDLGSAPAATFTEASSFSGAPVVTEGFSSGGFTSGFAGGGGGGISGGGFSGGGGGLLGGSSRLRLLAVGGIATAIAVGVSDDDDVSPTN